MFCIRGRLWWFLAHASLSDDAKRIHSISYDSLPRLDVFCGGLVITNKCTKLCSELKLDTKLFPRVCFEAYVQGARLRAIFLSSLSSRAKGDDDENN